MSSIGIDFTGLFIAFAIAAAAALLGTPALWRLSRGLPSFRRGVLSVLGALGIAGLASAFAVYALRDRELAAFALGLTVLLQILVLPVLLYLARKGN
jgi:hypothetical protein